jgi:multimeric flavodoxin WrbA
MKVIAFNGSPRKGNTEILIREVFAPFEEAGIETELVQIGGQVVRGCTGCRKCFENQDRRCILTEDSLNDWLEKLFAADGVILASPTYFADITPELKAFIDRSGYVALANGGLLRRKVGAGVVAVRRGGQVHAFDSINHYFFIQQMVVPGSCYWNMGIGREVGEVRDDEEGMRTMRILGENMAWLMKKLAE